MSSGHTEPLLSGGVQTVILGTFTALAIATVIRDVETSGAIFIGPYSAVAIGDFLAGPSHTLPTGGAGKSFSGLTADMFQRRTSIVDVGRNALKKSANAVRIFAEIEGLDAHGKSVSIRNSD